MTIRYIVGVNMEKVIKIKKELTTLEKKHLINKRAYLIKFNYIYINLLLFIIYFLDFFNIISIE